MAAINSGLRLALLHAFQLSVFQASKRPSTSSCSCSPAILLLPAFSLSPRFRFFFFEQSRILAMDGFGEGHSPRPRLPLSRFSAEQKGKAPARPDHDDDDDIEAGQSSRPDFAATAGGSSDPRGESAASEDTPEKSARGGEAEAEAEASGSSAENQHTEMEIDEVEQFGNDYPDLSDGEEEIEDSEAQKEMDDAVQGMRRIFTTLMWREAEEQLPGIAFPFFRRV